MKLDNGKFVERNDVMTINRNNVGNAVPVMSEFPAETPLAMAYVPFQKWEEPYDEQVAIERGTIFPSLDLPFIGEEAVPRVRKK